MRLALLLVSATLPLFADRPAPSGPADDATRRAAWRRHVELERSSPFAGLPWRCVGPIAQGGRIVDIESDTPPPPYPANTSEGAATSIAAANAARLVLPATLAY